MASLNHTKLFLFALLGLHSLSIAWCYATEENVERKDWRNIEEGSIIPTANYADQPYIAKTKSGNWLCVLTTGEGHEGNDGQYVGATLSKDYGKTWSELKPIEEPGGPVASWAMPLVVDSGRVYVFYDYNGDNVTGQRADMLGWYCYRYSDDEGETWSRRFRLPVRETEVDRNNGMNGVQMFWGIGEPIVASDENGQYAIFGFTKIGKYLVAETEGWFFRSNNILSEADPNQIEWEMLPDGEKGLRAPEHGSVQAEHNLVELSNGTLYCMYRTAMGYPCHAYSYDGGHGWTKPVPATYSPNGTRMIKNPRACPRLFKCENGKYLFWFHNNGHRSWWGRNPVWLLGGVERDGKIAWSQPELILYSHEQGIPGMSYPDLVESDGRYWISETQKDIARIHEIPSALLEAMWEQVEQNTQVHATVSHQNAKNLEPVLVLSREDFQLAQGSKPIKMPKLGSLKEDESFSIDFWIRLDDLAAGQRIFETHDDRLDRNMELRVIEGGRLELSLDDGLSRTVSVQTDAGLIKAGERHHVTFIVDGEANIISCILDGRFCDGGKDREFGWNWIDPFMRECTTRGSLIRFDPSFRGELLSLNIHDCRLTTAEAIQKFRQEQENYTN